MYRHFQCRAVSRRLLGRGVTWSLLGLLLLAFSGLGGQSQETPREISTNLLAQPLSLEEAIEIALRQNSAILQGQAELRAAHGLAVQTRSVALPRVGTVGNYTANEASGVEQFPIPSASPISILIPSQNWSARVQVTQTIYQGGQLMSALRRSRLTEQEAMLNYQSLVADTLLRVQIAYDDTLLAAEQIGVREASVRLLTRELEDMQRRFQAGTVPRFNVLRAEVELANARPPLIAAKNAYRIGKANLVNLLGYNVPKQVWEDIPLKLSGQLEARPFQVALPVALEKALQHRTELAALRKAERLRRENVISARAGYKPSAQLFAGYGAQSPTLEDNLGKAFDGWFTGAQVSWDIFDGRLTRGRVIQAEALHERAQLELDDLSRRIELQVRTSYSDFVQAKEVLESQRKVQEQAEEALRLAQARIDAGAGTQLDVLGAQTSLTEARTTQVQALRDYSVARARLERAIGETLRVELPQVK